LVEQQLDVLRDRRIACFLVPELLPAVAVAVLGKQLPAVKP
jgi:hypothetical protein